MAKPRNFNEVHQSRAAQLRHVSPEIANRSDTRSDTRKTYQKNGAERGDTHLTFYRTLYFFHEHAINRMNTGDFYANKYFNHYFIFFV